MYEKAKKSKKKEVKKIYVLQQSKNNSYRFYINNNIKTYYITLNNL